MAMLIAAKWTNGDKIIIYKLSVMPEVLCGHVLMIFKVPKKKKVKLRATVI